MKFILVLFAFILSTLNMIFAQDIMIKQNGDVIKAYNIDITEKSIYYKLGLDENDNIGCVLKEDLIMIKKEDGSILSFAEKTVETSTPIVENTQIESDAPFPYETAEILYNMTTVGKGGNYILSLNKSKTGGWSVQTKATDIKRENGEIEIEYLYTFMNKKGTKQSANAKLAGFGDGFFISTFIKDSVWVVSHDYIFGYAKNMAISGYVVEIPYDIKVGDKLKTSTLYIKGEFMRKNFTSTLNYENFVVVGEEDVTTTAGVFKCYKIEGRITGDSNTLKIDNSQEWWINRDIGIVKITTDYYGGMEYVLESLSN